MMKLVPLDIIFCALILIAAIHSALKGFVAEIMSLAAFIFGIIFAFLFYKNGAAYIRGRFFTGQALPEIVAFMLLFLVIFIAVKILEYVLRDIISRINLGGVDRLLGGLFGILEGLCLVSVILFIISVQPVFNAAPLLSESFFAHFLAVPIAAIQDVFIRSQGVPPAQAVPGV